MSISGANGEERPDWEGPINSKRVKQSGHSPVSLADFQDTPSGPDERIFSVSGKTSLNAPATIAQTAVVSETFAERYHCDVSQPELSLMGRVAEDHRNYYSLQNLGLLSLGFGAGAIVANTQLDEQISQHFNTSIQHAPSDEWAESFHAPKEFGNGLFTLPVFAAAWGIGSWYEGTAAGDFSSEWGERSLRAFMVGAPPVILMQKVLGSGRPEEGESHWHFWQDSNGVSGHSFMGALPFLTAAQMVDDPLYKCLLYAGSTAVPLSRVTDGDHYPSQAILGWWMAWSAAMAVDATQDHDTNWRAIPWIESDFSGVNFEFRW